MKDKQSTDNDMQITLNAHVVFQFGIDETFNNAEVQRDSDGDEEDFEPTDKALAERAQEIKDYLSQVYCVHDVSVIDCETSICVQGDPELSA